MESEIKKNKPNLAPSSIKTYLNILNSLGKKMGIEGDYETYYKKNSNKVLDFLKDEKPSRRKTILSALVVLCGECHATKKYRDQMMKDQETYITEEKNQSRNETQKENWMSWNEIKNVFEELEKEVKPLLAKKIENLTDKNIKRIQEYILLAVYVLIPPRRALDYTNFKITDVDPKTDNYYDLKKKEFVFNKYKTSKKHGEQRVKVPLRLQLILKKWLAINPSDMLFWSENGKELKQNQITNWLNKIFDKKISVNMLRHIYITENVLKDMPKLTHLEDIANDMGNTVGQQMLYVKRG
jgi:integrase